MEESRHMREKDTVDTPCSGKPLKHKMKNQMQKKRYRNMFPQDPATSSVVRNKAITTAYFDFSKTENIT